MEALKGIAEIIDHILYELLALLIPGAAMALITAWILGPESWKDVVEMAGKQPWIAGGAAYLLGYAVQGVSRPVVGGFAWVLRRPARVLWWLARTLVPGQEARLIGWGKGIERVLLGRHKHGTARAPAEQEVQLDELAREQWQRRLGLPADRVLSISQVRDLSFSELLPARGRLDRFRAATSLCRGVATSVAVAFVLVCVQLAAGDREPTLHAFLLLEGLVVAFYALLERADMYNDMWNRVIQPQFLALSTRPQSAQAGTSGSEAHAGSVSRQGGLDG